PGLPAPTDLAFSALTGGGGQFYAATAGRESAELGALSLSVEGAPGPGPGGAPAGSPSGQLGALEDTALPLGATVRALAISADGEVEECGPAEAEAIAVAASFSGSGTSVGQGAIPQRVGGSGADSDEVADESRAGQAGSVPGILSPWERFILGLDEAL